MTEPTSRNQPSPFSDRTPRGVRSIALATLGLSLSAGLIGCAGTEGGVPLDQTAVNQPAVDTVANHPAAPSAPDPADVMFQSSEPFARPVSDVNVFGELDGIGPSPFDAGGTAGLRQVTAVEEGYDADQTVSPDGQWVLFSSTRHSERPDIYVQRVGGQAVTQLTADDADDSFPRFSPDGSQIVFASNRSGNWDIYLMDVDGKNVRQLTRSNAQEIHPSFSPDGTRIVYSSLGTRSGQWELWTVDLHTAEHRMIGYGLFPDWSPRRDKDVIAFQRARQRGTRWFSVWTLDLVDGEAKDLTEIAYSANAAIVAPTWSPDGRRIAFGSIADPQAAEDAHGRSHARSATGDVWVANADGSDRRKLTDGRGVNASPAWGVDGRIYFVSDRGGHESIWSTPAGFPTGDMHARRPRLPDTYDQPPVEAEPAAHHVNVPPVAPPVMPPPAHEPSPFVTVEPAPQPTPQPTAHPEPTPVRPQPPTQVVKDEPIVLRPESDAHHERANAHADPEDLIAPIGPAEPANQPVSVHPTAHDEPADAPDPGEPNHAEPEPAHAEPSHASPHGGH